MSCPSGRTLPDSALPVVDEPFSFSSGLSEGWCHTENHSGKPVDGPPGPHPPGSSTLGMRSPKGYRVKQPKLGQKLEIDGSKGSDDGKIGAISAALPEDLSKSRAKTERKRKGGVDTKPPPSPGPDSPRHWSARQARSAGLERRYYPAFLRDLVDYDYDQKLPEEARRWLGAFTEEHYRGWRVKSERQVHSVEMLRAAGAEKERLRRRAKDGGGATTGSLQALTEAGGDSVALDVLAGRMGRTGAELRGLNVVEDALVEALDAHRLVGQVVERAALAVSPALVPSKLRARISRARVARLPPRLECSMSDSPESPPLGEARKFPAAPADYRWIELDSRGWHVTKSLQVGPRNTARTVCDEALYRPGEPPSITWLPSGEVPEASAHATVCADCVGAVEIGLPSDAVKPKAARAKKAPSQPLLKGLKVPKDKKPEPCAVPGCSPVASDREFCAHHKSFLNTPERKSIIERNKRLTDQDNKKRAPRAKKKAPCGHMVVAGGWCRCPAAKALREGHSTSDAARGQDIIEPANGVTAPDFIRGTGENEIEKAARLVREVLALGPELLSVVRKELAA